MSKRQRKAVYWQDAPIAREQLVLFSSSLEERIPTDHPVRMLDELLDHMDWKEWEANYHGSMGQPPIHPSVLCKVLLFATLQKLRSSRRIEYALKHSIDFMWLASGREIDHRTLCVFRRKHSKALRMLFKDLVKLAVKLNVAKLSELCIDGTRVLANANKYKTWTSARLEKLINVLDTQMAEALSGLEEADQVDEDLLGNEYPSDKLPPELADMGVRREKLAEHLETLQEMDGVRKASGTKGAAQLPKTDPDSRILPNKEGGYAANYTPMATTDSHGGFIVDCGVMIGNVEHHQVPSILDGVTSDYGVTPESVLVDAAYTTGANLTESEEREVELVGPLQEPKCADNPAHRDDLSQPVPESEIENLPLNPQTKRFDKTSFVYDEASDSYYCPAGKALPYRNTKKADSRNATPRRVFVAEGCSSCALVSMCMKHPSSKKGREITDDIHEPARRRHRKRMASKSAQTAYARRSHPGETPFAAIKAAFDLRRFLLRGIDGVEQEWLWASTAFNLKKLLGHWHTVRAHLDKPTMPITD